MRPSLLFVPLAAALGLGCLNQPTGAALVQQTTQEFNVNTRFGRMALASEDVAPSYRAEFAKRHRMWGGPVRVTDAETAGMRMKGVDQADVLVRVGWYRVDEGDLHVTTIKQSWHRYKTAWLLDGEERTDGDVGVLGERVEVLRPDGPEQHAQFPTIRIAD
jgi:hypothetical protein